MYTEKFMKFTDLQTGAVSYACARKHIRNILNCSESTIAKMYKQFETQKIVVTMNKAVELVDIDMSTLHEVNK